MPQLCCRHFTCCLQLAIQWRAYEVKLYWISISFNNQFWQKQKQTFLFYAPRIQNLLCPCDDDTISEWSHTIGAHKAPRYVVVSSNICNSNFNFNFRPFLTDKLHNVNCGVKCLMLPFDRSTFVVIPENSFLTNTCE